MTSAIGFTSTVRSRVDLSNTWCVFVFLKNNTNWVAVVNKCNQDFASSCVLSPNLQEIIDVHEHFAWNLSSEHISFKHLCRGTCVKNISCEWREGVITSRTLDVVWCRVCGVEIILLPRARRFFGHMVLKRGAPQVGCKLSWVALGTRMSKDHRRTQPHERKRILVPRLRK